MKKLNDKDFLEKLKNDFNISLNEGQEKSALTIQGSVQVVAVPGAGKTFSTCIRLFNMVWNYCIDPSKILAVTFSKASAKDMDNKFNSLFYNALTKDNPDYPNNPVEFSTIHSFAYRILRDYSQYSNITYDIIESKKKIILTNIYKNICQDILTDDTFELLTRAISYCKNKLLTLQDIKYSTQSIHPKFYEIYIAYEDYKSNNNLIDYDDMLCKALSLIKSNKYIKDKYKTMYDYILVDEAQDTSTVQFELIKSISTKHNVYIVGDDDQNLYEWRSADIDNFLHFDKHFPNTVKIFMEQNYRSTKKIIMACNEFIKSNENRYDKNLFTDNEEGENINIIQCSTYNDEMEYLVTHLKNVQDLNNYAILFRNNVSAFAVANMLAKNNIPFYIKDYKTTFFKHWLLEDILNFLNVAMYPKDTKSFCKIAFKMNRYISKKMLYHISKIKDDNLDVFDKLLTFPDLKSFQKENIITLRQEFQRIKSKNSIAAIDYIYNDLGYSEYLENLSENSGISLDTIKERLFIIKEISSKSKSIFDFEDSIYVFQEELEKAKTNFNKNVVVLSTCHSSKGLEWDNVFMVDLNDGVFPSYKAISDAENKDFKLMEAERRLYYVGISRAKKNLYCIHTTHRNGARITPSQFTRELCEIGKKLNCCTLKEFSNNKSISNQVSLFNANKEITINSLADSSTTTKKKHRKSKAKTKTTKISENKYPFNVGSEVIHSTLGKGIITTINDNFIEFKLSDGTYKKLNYNTCIKKSLLKYA